MGTFRKLLIAVAGLLCCLPVFGKAEVSRNLPHSTGTLLTRYYIGGRYELDVTPSGTKERLYLGGDAYSAPMVYARDGSEPDLLLGRGFTGHEHLSWCGLINMNARLYDPLTGRFLSPDPYVQAPDFTQNFNRYSYVLNNPLKYTDESGEWIGWDDVIAGLIGGAINWAINGCKFTWEGLGYFGIGAAAGVASLYVSPVVVAGLQAGANTFVNQGFGDDGQKGMLN